MTGLNSEHQQLHPDIKISVNATALMFVSCNKIIRSLVLSGSDVAVGLVGVIEHAM